MSSLTEVRVPQENVNDQSVTVLSWLATDKQVVRQGEFLAELETSKTTFEIESPIAGYLVHNAAEGSDIPIGEVLCFICPSLEHVEQLSSSKSGAEQDQSKEQRPQQQYQSTRFTKKAQKLIEVHKLDRNLFQGQGLVKASEVLRHLSGEGPEKAESESLPKLKSDRGMLSPTPSVGVSVRSEPITRSKRTEISYLRSAQSNTLQSIVTVSVPTRGFPSLIEQGFNSPGVASAMIVYEVARLLVKYPILNAFYAEDQHHYYQSVNIGYAMDAEKGLKVGVIRDADKKSIGQIVEEKQELLLDYLEERIPVEKLAGGTFTITDLSSQGVSSFYPLLNQGQSGILGIGGEFLGSDDRAGIYNLILGFDHQVVEGRVVADFLRDLRQRLQSYEDSCSSEAKPSPARPSNVQSDLQTAEVTELYCSSCSYSFSVIKEQGGFLIPTYGDESGNLRAICSSCITGW